MVRGDSRSINSDNHRRQQHWRNPQFPKNAKDKNGSSGNLSSYRHNLVAAADRAGTEVGPPLHHLLTSLEELCALVGRNHVVANLMRQRGFSDRVVIVIFGSPIAER